MTRMERRLLLGVAAALAALAVLVAFAFVRSFNASDNAARAIETVQHNRLDLIRASCEASNQRNQNTISTLNAEIAHLSARQQARAKASKRYTVALIDTLAPKQDCAALVARARINH